MIVVIVFQITNVTSQLVIDAGNNITKCKGEQHQLGGSPVIKDGSGNYIIQWNSEHNISNPNDSTPTITLKQSGYYYLYVKDNVTAQELIDSVFVQVNEAPSVEAGSDQNICLTGKILSISLGGNIKGPTNQGIWTTMGDGTFPAGDDILFTSYSLGPKDKLQDAVVIVLTSQNNGVCQAVSDSLKLFISPQIIADAGNDSIICLGNDTIYFNGIVRGSSGTGEWYTSGKGSFWPDNDHPETSYIIDEEDLLNAPITFALSSTNNGGCPGHSDTIEIDFAPTPELWTVNDTLVNSRYLHISAHGQNVSDIHWRSNGKGRLQPSDTSWNISYVFSTDEILEKTPIELIVEANSGSTCKTAADTVLIICNLENLPNAFTPNNDGINDIFMSGEEILIYNRWGQIIYNGNDGWDGTYNGNKVSSGTYYYVIKNYHQYREDYKRGSVTVIIDK